MPTHRLVDMLKFRRPEGSETQREFCEIYLEPVMGPPDVHGNYIHMITKEDGSEPNICFTAHHDTVHREGGYQHVYVHGDIATAPGSDCLGADCTTGVWLILGMIEARVPGVYVVHAGEEIGCVGSSALIKDNPAWLKHVDAVISFDRKGEESIITHQMGRRTASDAFATSLSKALKMPLMRPDDTGSYTDSNEYASVVKECTNLSVGYLHQHTSKEQQDIYFAYVLLDALCDADWSQLVFEREPVYDEWADFYGWGTTNRRKSWDQTCNERSYRSAFDKEDNVYELEDIIRDFPEELAELLNDWNVDSTYLMEQLDLYIYKPGKVNEYLNKRKVS